MNARARALGVALVVGVAVLAGLWFSEPVAPPIRPGQAAPEFPLPVLDAGTVSLASLRGRVVLLNFWATWCKPCLDEMPAMERLYQALSDGGFELLAVSVDAGSEEVRAFRDQLSLSFPILLDPEKRVSNAYQSYRYPESYLIDGEGRIVSRYIGPRQWDAQDYRDRIERLMSQTPGRGLKSLGAPFRGETPSQGSARVPRPPGGEVGLALRPSLRSFQRRLQRLLRPAWIGAALALMGLVYLGADSDRGLSTWLRLRQEVASAEARIAALRRANEALEADLHSLQSDGFAQERAIRELLGWARPGELVVRVPDARGDGLPLP